MSLYTKYRPQNFKDVVGQSAAVEYLKNIVEKNKNLQNENKMGEKIDKIPHAYLFSGGHGIGKTTLARIFARELGTAEHDIYELDAASSSKKIDDMREIIESAYTMPTLSPYKVYIFDEAHMLTKDSSNAFLKTLEEPPAHVIFILCTTDANKLIPTIRSRCNIINLKNPSKSELIDRIVYILKSENIILNQDKSEIESILDYIAQHSQGSFRDAITNFEKVLHTYHTHIKNKNLKLIDIENIFGKRSIEIYKDIYFILANTNKAEAENKKLESTESKEIKVQKVLNFCKENHSEFSYARYLECFRNAMLIRNKINIDDAECGSLEYRDFVKENESLFTSANLLYFLEKAELYNTINDKESALIAIFGNFIENNNI